MRFCLLASSTLNTALLINAFIIIYQKKYKNRTYFIQDYAVKHNKILKLLFLHLRDLCFLNTVGSFSMNRFTL